MKTPPVRIAVLGVGQIGRRHIEQIIIEPDVDVHAIIDPSSAARDHALALGFAWYPDLASMMQAGRPDGVLIATPNNLHVENALECIAVGLPTLVEKPLADSIAGGERIVAAGEAAGVPVLTGHHRRHNPMVRRARAIIEEGRLGQLVTVHAFFWLMKPDDYFDIPWRRQPGAGPVLMNLIHDIDLMRHLCGEVEAVQAFQSRMIRGNPIDETTALTLRFASGALGTVNISDTVVAPWSWEHTTGENPSYPRTDQPSYFLAGTQGSLALPRLEVWTNEATRSWWEPFRVTREIAALEDPLRLQVRQFAQVIRGLEAPLVSAREGLMTLKVIDAVQRAAATGLMVQVT